MSVSILDIRQDHVARALHLFRVPGERMNEGLVVLQRAFPRLSHFVHHGQAQILLMQDDRFTQPVHPCGAILERQSRPMLESGLCAFEGGLSICPTCPCDLAHCLFGCGTDHRAPGTAQCIAQQAVYVELFVPEIHIILPFYPLGRLFE